MAALPPLDALVRAGSGLIFLGLGVFVLVAARGRKHVALGTYLAAFGLLFVVQNLIRLEEANIRGIDASVLRDALSLPLYIVQIACLPVLVSSYPRGMDAGWRRRARLVAASAVVAMILVTVAWLRREDGALSLAEELSAYAFRALTLAWILALALAFPRANNDADRANIGLLSAGLILYLAYNTAFGLAPARFAADSIATRASFVFAAVGLAIVVVLWLWNTARVASAGRIARNVSLLTLTTALAGLALSGFVDPRGADTTGGIGVARVLGAVCIAWAIFRHDLLGVGLRARTIERGTLAAGALGALFIVAQIAQNFLSDEDGLLMGGLVAGALLVAARPIERALERRGAKPDASAQRDKEEAYRSALRFALRDRTLTREEEVELARLARHLGLAHEDAVRLRHEVDDELRARPR